MYAYLIPTVILGLIFGSFFNVVIYRTPIALEAKLQGKKNSSLLKQLSWPASFCPGCTNKISWLDNIPVFSWLLLGGKCRQCKISIKVRYLIVELLSAIIFSYCYLKFGLSFEAVYWVILFSLLLILFFIDAETFFLPDLFTISLILLALAGSFLEITNINFVDSLIGAILGFLILYLINLFYKIVRKVDGFGGGDFKLLAGIGAWFGWISLPVIIGMSSILGLLYILFMNVLNKKKLKLNTMIPFGPFLISSSLFMYANLYIFNLF